MLPLLWIVFAVICALAFIMAFYAFTENYDQWIPATIAIVAVACAVVLGINNVQRHPWEAELQKL